MYPRRMLMALLGVSALFSVSPVEGGSKTTAPVTCTQIHGALLSRASTKDWQALRAESAVPKDALLVALFGADFRSSNKAVEARMLADVGQRGPFPVLEAAVRFHAGSHDLEVTLERGILVLTNVKSSGAATVRVQITDEAFEVTLTAPKARLGVEIYGRHIAGPPRLTKLEDDAPVINAAFFAFEGDIVLAAKEQSVRLNAPPGPALVLWDNLTRMMEVQRFETLPDSVKPMSAKERTKFDKISGFAKAWTEVPGGVLKGVTQAVKSADAMERKAAVVALGALDDDGQLMQLLTEKHQADVRDTAIPVMRHWLGRATGQSIRLHAYLQKDGYTPIQAKNLIHLFNGIEKEKHRQPETYDLLIEALNHAKLPARELARWHLVRMAPAGKTIAYDAAAPEAARLDAMAAWRRLIPEGTVPKISGKQP